MTQEALVLTDDVPPRRLYGSTAPLQVHYLRSFLPSDHKGLSVPSNESQSAANDSVSSALSTDAARDLGGTWRLN